MSADSKMLPREPTEAMVLAACAPVCRGLPTGYQGACAAPDCECWERHGKPLLSEALRLAWDAAGKTVEEVRRAPEAIFEELSCGRGLT